MITAKHVNTPQSNSKIVILEINPDDKVKPSNNIFKSHKLKKLHITQTSRRSRPINIFQKFDFKEAFMEKFPFESLPIAAIAQRSHRSSYLAYKEEQKINKVKHYNKKNYLKNSILHKTTTLDTNIKARSTVKTQQGPRSKRKMSLVVLGEPISQGNQEVTSPSKSRNIYMKTSYGKRQKIDANTYMTKIKQKIQNLCDVQSTRQMASLSINYIQSTFNNVPIKMQPISHERQTLTRNIRARNFKKEQSFVKQDEYIQCRPWTSRNSDHPQQ